MTASAGETAASDVYIFLTLLAAAVTTLSYLNVLCSVRIVAVPYNRLIRSALCCPGPLTLSMSWLMSGLQTIFQVSIRAHLLTLFITHNHLSVKLDRDFGTETTSW